MVTKTKLINEVADDINRSDLTADCSAAVVSAIRYYSEKRWWFSEGSQTFTTQASVSAYALPGDYKATDYVETRWPGDNWQEIRERDFPHVRNMLEGQTITGYPEVYAIRDNKMHLAYPPNGAYLVKHYYLRNLAALSAGGSNEWTTDGHDLIRAHAAKRVALTKLHDPELAQLMEAVRFEEWRQLSRENDRRTSHGRIKPWY